MSEGAGDGLFSFLSRGHLKQLSRVPLAVLPIAILAFRHFDPAWHYEPPFLLMGLNVVFLAGVGMIVAWIVGDSFLRGAPVPVLLPGCGMLLFGLVSIFGGLLVLDGDINAGVATYNIGVFVAGSCHLLSALLVRRCGDSGSSAGNRWWGVSVFYSVTLICLALVLLLSLHPGFPTFFVQGEGTTLLRDVVLGAAIGVFGLSAWLLGMGQRRSPMPFSGGYSLGLGLIALGLLAVALTQQVGGALSWLGRTGQYLGGVYILVGVAAPYLRRRAGEGDLAAALQQSQQRYRELFSRMTEGFGLHEIITDAQGRPCDYRFLEVNPAFERLTGLERSEVVGRRATEVLPDLEPGWIEHFGRVAFSGEPTRFEDYSGSLDRWYEVYAYQPRHGQFAVVFNDVSERRRAEEALAHERRLLESIVQNIPVMLVVWDAALDRFTLNPHAQEVLGWTNSDANEGDFMSKVYPDPEYRAEVSRFMQSLSPKWREFINTAKDGERVPCRWTNVRLDDDTMVGIGIDLRERKKAEAELHELNQALEQRVAERTAEVQGQAEQLRALASQLSRAEQGERKRLAKVLHDHLQQLLVAARIQLNSLEARVESEAVRAGVQDVFETLGEAMTASRDLTADLSPPVLQQVGLGAGLEWLAARMKKRHHFTVHLRTDSAPEPDEEEIRFLLFECVRELLFNSLKHSGVARAGVALWRADDDGLQITVSDEGQGFDPTVLTNREADEVTFGLFSIQERLQHIGGRMEVDSAPGDGARISLYAPVGPNGGDAGEPPEIDAPEEALSADGRRKDLYRVLIVDDHKMLREGLVEFFQSEQDIEVVGEAGDGPEAVRLASHLEPDVVIMDVNLGEMSGVEATEKILSDKPHIRVIGLSMHTDEDVARTMRAVGAEAYLTKDGPSEDLIAAVRGD